MCSWTPCQLFIFLNGFYHKYAYMSEMKRSNLMIFALVINNFMYDVCYYHMWNRILPIYFIFFLTWGTFILTHPVYDSIWFLESRIGTFHLNSVELLFLKIQCNLQVTLLCTNKSLLIVINVFFVNRVFLAEQFQSLQSHLEGVIPASKKPFLQQFYSQVRKENILLPNTDKWRCWH